MHIYSGLISPTPLPFISISINLTRSSTAGLFSYPNSLDTFTMTRTLIGICAVVALLLVAFARPRKSMGLPPGPRPKPLIGNLLDLPPNGQLEYRHWLSHKDRYGPVSSVTIMGTTMIIIHDLPTARLLLEKLAAKTTQRPVFEFAQKLCGFDEILALRQPDEHYHQRRKLLRRGIGTLDRYSQIMEAESRQFLRQMLAKPNHLVQNLHTCVYIPWLPVRL